MDIVRSLRRTLSSIVLSVHVFFQLCTIVVHSCSLFGKATYVDVESGSYIDSVIAHQTLLTCMNMTNTSALNDDDIQEVGC
jgi:hypothetical protein